MAFLDVSLRGDLRFVRPRCALRAGVDEESVQTRASGVINSSAEDTSGQRALCRESTPQFLTPVPRFELRTPVQVTWRNRRHVERLEERDDQRVGAWSSVTNEGGRLLRNKGERLQFAGQPKHGDVPEAVRTVSGSTECAVMRAPGLVLPRRLADTRRRAFSNGSPRVDKTGRVNDARGDRRRVVRLSGS